MTKKEIEEMIVEIFSLCDRTVWIEDWPTFHSGFASILARHGMDIKDFVYKKSSDEMEDVYMELLKDRKKFEKRREARAKTNNIYVKASIVGKIPDSKPKNKLSNEK